MPLRLGSHTPTAKAVATAASTALPPACRISRPACKLTLNVGYSHPVEFAVEDGLKVECSSATDIKVSGIDKQRVGEFAANIRAVRKPEPYKGKGIKYADEVIRRKVGKTGKK